MTLYKEFKICDLFTSSNGDVDIQQKHLNNRGLPVISSGQLNFGIIGKTDIPSKVFDEHTLTVDMFGNVFFRDFKYKMVTHARVFSLKFKNKQLTVNEGLYFSTLLRYFSKMFSYSNMASWKKIKNLKVLVPINRIGEINFEIIDSQIKKIVKEHAKNLDQYLIKSGLEECELTNEEKAFLKIQPSYKEYKVCELFDVVGTKSLDEGKLSFCDEGINFVGRVGENNGIKGKISKQKFEPNEPYTITATVIGNYKYVKYQTQPYYCSQNINKLIPKFRINERIALYFIASIQKFVSRFDGQQGGYKLHELANHIISLPINSKNEADYDYMEKYISIQQKLAISPIVSYKNKIL